MLVAGADAKALHRWIRTWTGTAAYLRSLALVGARRFSLDGTAGEAVTEEHRLVALEKLRARGKRWEERRKQEARQQAKAKAKPKAPPPEPTGPNAARGVLRLPGRAA
jgi:sRNA-binding protein